MISALLMSMVVTTPGFSCLTPSLLPLPRHRVPRIYMLANPPEGKTERDAWGVYPHLLTSENFALKWGDQGSVPQETAEELIGYFEDAWAVEIVEMGHVQPAGSQTTFFNVYIGDTGSGTPSAYGAGGYYSFDDEGWPMIVVGLDVLAYPLMSKTVPPHEFYHALQDASGSFDGYYGLGLGAWYWEATAEWAVPEVYPDIQSYGVFLGGVAMVPHLPLTLFDYADEGTFTEMHQYGAFIFPRFLSEHVADRDLIADSWKSAGTEQDPLRVLDRLLASRGATVTQAFVDYAAHNATWDYKDGDLYAYIVDATAREYPDFDFRRVALVPPAGTHGWIDAPAETLPHAWGYNVIEVAPPAGGAMDFWVEASAVGSRGTGADFRAVVVRELAGGREYVQVPLLANSGKVRVEGLGGEQSLYLVVSVTAEETVSETFPYQYRIESAAPDQSQRNHDADDDQAGGCAGVAAGPLAALVALGVLARRRSRARG